MSELPERFFGIPFKDDESAHWLGQFWSVRCSEDDIELLRADTAIPRAEADAMVAAAVKKAAYVATNACLVPPDGGSPTPEEVSVCEEASRRILAIVTDGPRAAFEQAVQEAVEAERARCAQIADNALWDDPMDETESVRNRTLRSVAAAIRGTKETGETKYVEQET